MAKLAGKQAEHSVAKESELVETNAELKTEWLLDFYLPRGQIATPNVW